MQIRKELLINTNQTAPKGLSRWWSILRASLWACEHFICLQYNPIYIFNWRKHEKLNSRHQVVSCRESTLATLLCTLAHPIVVINLCFKPFSEMSGKSSQAFPLELSGPTFHTDMVWYMHFYIVLYTATTRSVWFYCTLLLFELFVLTFLVSIYWPLATGGDVSSQTREWIIWTLSGVELIVSSDSGICTLLFSARLISNCSFREKKQKHFDRSMTLKHSLLSPWEQ